MCYDVTHRPVSVEVIEHGDTRLVVLTLHLQLPDHGIVIVYDKDT